MEEMSEWAGSMKYHEKKMFICKMTNDNKTFRRQW